MSKVKNKFTEKFTLDEKKVKKMKLGENCCKNSWKVSTLIKIKIIQWKIKHSNYRIQRKKLFTLE